MNPLASISTGHTSAAEWVERARRLAPLLQANAARAEAERRVPAENIDAMREAGLFRITVPARWGGYESSLRAVVDVCTTLAQADRASAWLEVIFSAHSWMAAMFPEEAQQEILGADPDALIAGTLAAQGRAEPVEGGWRVSGRWQFGSGCDHATWFLMGATQTTSTSERPRHVHILVPRADAAIDDTWFVLGLRGTGSKDIVLENVFVPAHRSIPTGTLFGGRSPAAAAHPTHLYLLPVEPGLGLFLGGAILGFARSGLSLFVERTKSRLHMYTGSAKVLSAPTQVRIAESWADIEAADLLLHRACDEIDRLYEQRELANVESRTKIVWLTASAVQHCRRAVERIYAAAGAHAVYDLSPLQAVFRDINVASHHAAVDYDGAAELFGRVTLGLDPGNAVM